MTKAIGIDIGGTSVKGIVTDVGGRLLARGRVPTDARRGRDAILESVEALIAGLRGQCPEAAGVGIAAAGRINAATGEVVYATDNLPGWRGTQLAEWAESRFGLPAAAENDANAALLGEAWLGAGRGLAQLVMLTLGTGVGGANMAGGRLIHGASWSGGEWGHSVLIPGGTPCNCGRRGCLEQYVSGTALVRLAGEAAGKRYVTGKDVLADAAAGARPALDAVKHFAERLALAVGNLKEGYDPEAVLIGGGLTESGEVWWAMLEEALRAEGTRAVVKRAMLGNDAGAFGAAHSVLARLAASKR